MTKRKSIYVISGGPGFGKTELIEELKLLGYRTGSEIARTVISEQMANNGTILPWIDMGAFQCEVLNRRIEFFNAINDNEIAFSDRGIPDQAGFARFHRKKILPTLENACADYRYAEKVFITPPWFEIYKTDAVRNESFEEAYNIHKFIVNAYISLGYQIIELPFLSVSERAKFVLDKIAN